MYPIDVKIVILFEFVWIWIFLDQIERLGLLFYNMVQWDEFGSQLQMNEKI